MSQEVKVHLVSALYTFLTGVALVVIPQLDSITLQDFETGAITGLLFAGVRMGIKMVGELIITWSQEK